MKLGDMFYDDIENSDSAIVWYSYALRYHYDAVRSPRVLFILAELSNTHAGKKYSTPGEYSEKLEHDFPTSLYAKESRRLLGKTSVSNSDTAAERYRQAEQLIDAKQYEKACDVFSSIPVQFPGSRFAAQSDYAVAWVWEYGLLNSDSAIVHYKRVVKKYPETIYAAQASKRYFEQADTTKKDTTTIHNVSPITAPSNLPPNGKPNLQPALQDSINNRPPMPNDLRKSRRPVKDLNDK